MQEEKCVLDPRTECIGSIKAAILEKRIEALEAWQKDSKKFHQDFYDWQRDQIVRQAKMDAQLEGMETNINKIVFWQESQQSKPQKFLDEIKSKTIWAVVAAIIAFVLARFGF